MDSIQIITLMESGVLSSSSSSDSSDDEILYTVICNGIHHVKPKVKDFVVNVVHSFTDDEVGLTIHNLISI